MPRITGQGNAERLSLTSKQKTNIAQGNSIFLLSLQNNKFTTDGRHVYAAINSILSSKNHQKITLLAVDIPQKENIRVECPELSDKEVEEKLKEMQENWFGNLELAIAAILLNEPYPDFETYFSEQNQHVFNKIKQDYLNKAFGEFANQSIKQKVNYFNIEAAKRNLNCDFLLWEDWLNLDTDHQPYDYQKLQSICLHEDFAGELTIEDLIANLAKKLNGALNDANKLTFFKHIVITSIRYALHKIGNDKTKLTDIRKIKLCELDTEQQKSLAIYINGSIAFSLRECEPCILVGSKQNYKNLIYPGEQSDAFRGTQEYLVSNKLIPSEITWIECATYEKYVSKNEEAHFSSMIQKLSKIESFSNPIETTVSTIGEAEALMLKAYLADAEARKAEAEARKAEAEVLKAFVTREISSSPKSLMTSRPLLFLSSSTEGSSSSNAIIQRNRALSTTIIDTQNHSLSSSPENSFKGHFSDDDEMTTTSEWHKILSDFNAFKSKFFNQINNSKKTKPEPENKTEHTINKQKL